MPAFPPAYADSFMRYLASPESGVSVITYADLDFDGDVEHEGDYPHERSVWEARIASGEIDPSRIYVVLQHDVDSWPLRTNRLLQVQSELGVRSTVMIFNRSVNKKVLEGEGRVEFVDYPIDRTLLAQLESRGWVVAYHSNALERGGFDDEVAAEMFRLDVDELGREFDIRFFCPHGGARSPQGRVNADFGMPEDMRGRVRWTLNRHSVQFDGAFSDGGLASRLHRSERLDLRRFVRSWQPGRRYRVLMHPQYYGEPFVPEPSWAEVPWYSRMTALAQSGDSLDGWWRG